MSFLLTLLNLLEVGILDGIIALGVVSASLLTCVSTVEALSSGTCARHHPDTSEQKQPALPD